MQACRQSIRWQRTRLINQKKHHECKLADKALQRTEPTTVLENALLPAIIRRTVSVLTLPEQKMQLS
jgi:hypothetical protein